MENYKELTDLVSCYWNSRAKDFSVFRKDEYHSVQFDKWALELKEKLGANRNAKVLDVGCGSGFLSAILTTLGYEVTGVLRMPLTQMEAPNAERLAKAMKEFGIL